jgi:hypothetical protein
MKSKKETYFVKVVHNPTGEVAECELEATSSGVAINETMKRLFRSNGLVRKTARTLREAMSFTGVLMVRAI